MHQLGRQVGRHLADEIVQTWLRQSAQAVAAMSTAVRERDSCALRAAAHTLKGSSATVGAEALAAACSDLEGAHGWDDCQVLLDHAGALLSPTNDALRQLLRSLMVEAARG